MSEPNPVQANTNTGEPTTGNPTPTSNGNPTPPAGGQGATPPNPTPNPNPDPAAATPPNGEGAPGDGKKEGEPTTYKDFTMPEGMAVDKPALERFVPIAQKLKLTQEQAQELVSVAAEHIKGVEARLADAQKTMWQQQTETWFNEVNSDPEFGGANFAKTNEQAARVIREFASTDPKQRAVLKDFLESTGLGNHPEMVKMFARIGKRIGESTTVDGQPPVNNAEPKSPAAVLYPNLPKAS